jgi:hypothetical protein|tara:strand:+ start:4358 stop:5224 length:867 start_codon:yes stop_codon:yes gene_type:complete
MALTDQEYYSNSSKWGDNQYVSLKDVINNFYAFYVGDDKALTNVKRYDVIFHAKRGLQELHYDALKEVKSLELELPGDLTLTLPKDFIKAVRISWVGQSGKLHPMMVDDTTVIAKSYLQDEDYTILFNSAGEASEATPYMDLKITERNNTVSDTSENQDNLTSDNVGGRFGMDTSKANINGMYVIDKKLGIIRFSSEVKSKFIVIEYITDGVSYLEEADLTVNKLAEDYLYKYIAHQIVSYKFGVQEYIVRRFKNQAFAALKNMKVRMMNIHPFDLVQIMKGRNKWIK